MDPYVFFFSCLLIGTPTSIVGLLCLIFDFRLLDLPCFLYVAFAAAVIATAGMAYVAIGQGRFSITVLFAFHLGFFVPFLFMSLSRMFADLAARVEESKVPVEPFAAALAAERKRELHEAALLWEEYLDGAPDDAEALRRYCGCLVKLARFDEAVEAQRKASRLLAGTRRIDAGLEVAYILEAKKGDPEAAEAEIEKLKSLCRETELEHVLEEKIIQLRVRITCDPRPFEEKIEFAPDPRPNALD